MESVKGSVLGRLGPVLSLAGATQPRTRGQPCGRACRGEGGAGSDRLRLSERPLCLAARHGGRGKGLPSSLSENNQGGIWSDCCGLLSCIFLGSVFSGVVSDAARATRRRCAVVSSLRAEGPAMTKQQRCSRELTRVPVCSLGVCPCAGVASGRHLISPLCQHLRPGAPSDRPATLREPFSTTQLPWRTCACACACARARDCAGACSHETWQVVRRSLKSEMQAKAKMRDVSHMKVIEYEGGKSANIRTRPSLASPLIFSPCAPPVLSFVVLYICKHPISCQPLKHARLWPGCRHDGPSGGVGVSRLFTGEWAHLRSKRKSACRYHCCRGPAFTQQSTPSVMRW